MDVNFFLISLRLLWKHIYALSAIFNKTNFDLRQKNLSILEILKFEVHLLKILELSGIFKENFSCCFLFGEIICVGKEN